VDDAKQAIPLLPPIDVGAWELEQPGTRIGSAARQARQPTIGNADGLPTSQAP
jgi:hypothetical protein